MVPGVHGFLREYTLGIERVRARLGREDVSTVDSLMSLAFSPWSQGLPPIVEATADLSMRLCVRDPSFLSTFTGKAYLPDATSERDAIALEPHLRRPSQSSLQDNPFSSSYEHIDTFFNAANALVLVARCCADEGADADTILTALREAIAAVSARPRDREQACYGAHAIVLLCCMYPVTWSIGADMIPAVWARVCASAIAFEPTTWTAEETAAADQWRARLLDPATGAFVHLAPLLATLHDQDGSHSVSEERVALVRTQLVDAVRAAWFLHSADGVAPPAPPCPAHAAKTHAHVRRPHIDPVFVGDAASGVGARGCLVGMKPFQYRQVLNLVLGAATIHARERVCIQVARNEGGLCLRVSSACDILTQDGTQRTDKAVSPVQTEADEAAFGSREDKLRGCRLQREAWDRNAELLAPVLAVCDFPLPAEQRRRGLNGASQTAQKNDAVEKKNLWGHVPHRELDAQAALERAAVVGDE